MTLGNRVGVFLVIIGAGLIGLFILSDIAQAPECGLLLMGVLILIVGIILLFSYPNPTPATSTRFRSLKKKPKKEKKKAIEEAEK